jgi:hypothetical protein
VIAYFDTQTYDHIYRKVGCTGADVANLRKAIYGRQLSIRLSIHTLEEILLGRKASPQALTAQIKLTLSLASSRTLLKPSVQLLLDDIRAYAAEGQSARPFLAGDNQNTVADGIATLIESDGEELEEDFFALLEQVREERQRFVAMLGYAQQMADAGLKSSPESAALEQCLDAAALPVLEAWAELAGVRAGCLARGFDGLLRIKTLRVSLGAAFAGSRAQYAPRQVDLTVVHHAVAAAAVAQMYVSDSPANRDLFAHLPVAGLDVASLPEFLRDLT